MTLVNTQMQSLRSAYKNQFDKNELRESRYGALRAFQDDSREAPIFDEETQSNIKRSFGNNVVVPVLDAETIASLAGYTRTCNIVDSENTSNLVTLSFNTYGWGFSMVPATHYNNDVKYETDFQRKMRKFILAFAAELDTLCVTQLSTDKNQLWTGIAPGYFAAQATNMLTVPQTEKNDLFNKVPAIMQTADFYDQVRIIGSTSIRPIWNRLLNPNSYKGFVGTNTGSTDPVAGGASSEEWQLLGMKLYNTNRLAIGAGNEASLYAVERGSLYINNRNDADTVLGARAMGGGKVWEEENVPVVDMRMGVYYQEDCTDASAMAGAATAGNTRSLKEGWEFSTDVVVATAYNSAMTTRYNPIIGMNIKS
jgi:hypothetical protein